MTSSAAALRQNADFDQIEAAVMETARGRWFLTEYARRHRTSDTESVLRELVRLEAVIRRQNRPAPAPALPKPVEAKPAPTLSRDKQIKADIAEATRLLQRVADATPATAEPSTDAAEPLLAALAAHEEVLAKLSKALGRKNEPSASTDASAPAPIEPSTPLTEPPTLSFDPPAKAEAEPALAIPPSVTAQLDALLARLAEPETMPTIELPMIPAPADPSPRQPVSGATMLAAWRERNADAKGVEDPTAQMSRGEKIALFS